jgi:hypothetical protein
MERFKHTLCPNFLRKRLKKPRRSAPPVACDNDSIGWVERLAKQAVDPPLGVSYLDGETL